MKVFDRKFGVDFVAGLPATPGVYLFRDAAGRVIYVGKAKVLRRRLGTYRNATRRKAHRKMRAIVRAAQSVEVRSAASEEAALLLENELIRSLRPAFNVEGKFDFLYPAIGLVAHPRHLIVCFSTDPDAFEALDLRWFGCFRSRPRAKEAFEALVEVLGYVGHREKAKDLPEHPRIRGSLLRGFRQVDPAVANGLEDYLGGESAGAVGGLAVALLEKPRARRAAADVQAHLKSLAAFFESDLRPLREALHADGRVGTFVAQADRDALFIRHGGGRPDAAPQGAR